MELPEDGVLSMNLSCFLRVFYILRSMEHSMVCAPIFQSKACWIVFRFTFKVLIPPPILRHIRISSVSIKIHFYDSDWDYDL